MSGLTKFKIKVYIESVVSNLMILCNSTMFYYHFYNEANVLKELFLSTMQKYSKNPSYSIECWNELETLYSQENRYYHTLKHIRAMISLMRDHKEDIKSYDTVLFAIFYHDAIYDISQSDNELQSANLLAERLSKSVFTDIETCKQLIESTENHRETSSADSLLFTDIDLSILGSNPSVYDQYMHNIRKEYQTIEESLYRKGRLDFLLNAINSETIYKTSSFQDSYEIQARSNISREIQLLSNRHYL